MVVTLDASTGDFVILILVQSDDTKTHLLPLLIPFPGIALQIINTLGHSICFLLRLKSVAHPLCAHLAPVQSFCHDGVNSSDAQSDLGGYGFHYNSAVLGNESINQLDDIIDNAV